MSRPQPTVIMKWDNPDGYNGIDVCESEGVSYYAVLYKEKPFHLRYHLNTETYAPGGTKYPKTVFANAGHAFRLADKLNRLFDCNDFAVHRMANGYQVKRPTKDY